MMRVAIGLAFFMSTVALTQADSGEAGKAIIGDYVIKEMTKGSKAAPKAIVDSFEGVTIAVGTITIKSSGETRTAEITVDDGKKPATIDLKPTAGPEKGKTMPGIYKHENGALTLVFTAPGQTRPANFDASGPDEIRIVLERKAK
ncbi:MAG: TIGR03067 domain-containing protein [Bacteroidales bacterium]|nr:TIGR03067 domain-containing protein [Bacteroidales bacterium]